MELFLYNTLTKSKQRFVPIDSKNVRMYVCGPTVYDLIHIGNARTSIVYDVLYRILIKLYGGSAVQYARNITDIDDKIIAKANELKISVKQLTQDTIQDFEIDHHYLGCLTPDFQPKATEHIDHMIKMISILIDRGYAYAANEHVYFAVSKAKNYTELTGRKLEDLVLGEEQNAAKKSAGDFVLWKPAKLGEDTAFESPWSKGRPGWHIECSAMINHLFGADFDIHGGGVDLVFPHHTNEIAQSTSAYPSTRYAKFWVHTGFLTRKKEKMSKSLQNFVTVRDLQKQAIPSEAFRIFILNTHYRKPLNFSEKTLHDSLIKLNYLYGALKHVQYLENLEYTKTEIANCTLPKEFMSFLLDDMNTHMAINYIYQLAEEIYKNTPSPQSTIVLNFIKCANFLGLLTKKSWKSNVQSLSKDKVEQIERLINQRKVARDKKQWQISDKIRNNLLRVGIHLVDHSDNSTTWNL